MLITMFLDRLPRLVSLILLMNVFINFTLSWSSGKNPCLCRGRCIGGDTALCHQDNIYQTNVLYPFFVCRLCQRITKRWRPSQKPLRRTSCFHIWMKMRGPTSSMPCFPSTFCRERRSYSRATRETTST